MVELLVDRVLVAEDEVEIRYVVPAHPNSEKVRSCHLRKDYFDDVVQIGAVRQRQRRPSSPVCFNTATALAYAGCPSTLITRGRGAPLHNASRRNRSRRDRVPFGRQHELDRLAGGVDGPIQVCPATCDLDVGFVHVVLAVFASRYTVPNQLNPRLQ